MVDWEVEADCLATAVGVHVPAAHSCPLADTCTPADLALGHVVTAMDHSVAVDQRDLDSASDLRVCRRHPAAVLCALGVHFPASVRPRWQAEHPGYSKTGSCRA
jgi:hypothetical protein